MAAALDESQLKASRLDLDNARLRVDLASSPPPPPLFLLIGCEVRGNDMDWPSHEEQGCAIGILEPKVHIE